MSLIVGVHGAFHQYWGPNQLRSRWLPALRDGLAHHGIDIRGRDVGIAFYGDLFRPDVEEGRPDDDEIRAIALRSGLLDLIEERFGEGGYELLAEELGREHLRQLINQLVRYFDDAALRSEVQARLAAEIGPETRVVVAHSMGTVVAYEVLARGSHAVDTLVTLGSPLAGEFVRGKLDPPVTAEVDLPGVRRWVNVVAIGDGVVRNPDFASWFRDIETVLVDNGPDAHRADPYLNARTTGEAIAGGLTGSS